MTVQADGSPSGRPRAAPAFLLAALVAAASLGGILLPSAYARETRGWAAQGIGQDWFDLVVLAPFLILCGVGLLRRSRAALALYGGGLVFSLYTFVIYTFAVHFNALFLVYCAALGVSFFALVGLAGRLQHEDARAWYSARAPLRLTGGYLTATGVLFYGLWLSDVVPALWRGAPPASLAEVGLLTNPVHVLDLSIVLPTIIVGGVSLFRRRQLGYALAPVMLAFSALMLLSIAELFVVMHLRGVPANLGLAAILGGVGLASAGLLARLLTAPAETSPRVSRSGRG